MTKQDLSAIPAKLIAWYHRARRTFPWRDRPDPYWVWIAEIMSQQTQMTTLVPYFRRFIEQFPTVEVLAAAPIDAVLVRWAGLGYYSRARNIHAASKQIVFDLGGVFPKTSGEWLNLPGVGPYTAAAIASQCFGEPVPVWDGNVHRVFSRLTARRDVWTKHFRSEWIDLLQVVIREVNPSDLNQSLMELGALICRPKSPDCGSCPIRGECRANELALTESMPPPKPRKAEVSVQGKVWISMRRSGHDGEVELMLKQRSQRQWFNGMWDFTTELGNVDQPIVALQIPKGAKAIGTFRHSITHHKITLEGFCSEMEEELKPPTGEHCRWISIQDLCSDVPPIALSATAKKALKLLQRRPQCLNEN